ncbi:MAG: rod shape-determining protein MreC [Bdellovibrio sp.]|nr:MAG: rod shape-determining protein MreC [Bdellovibrio sp.]
MNRFHLNLRKVLAYGFAIFFPLLSLNMQHTPFDSGWFNQPLQWAAAGVQQAFYLFSEGVRGTTSEYVNLLNIKSEISHLQEENQQLRARLSVLDDVQKENQRLNALLDFRSRTKMELVAARVISRDLFSDHSTIRINKGKHHGLQAGQAVISTEGALGYVFRPEAFSSMVLLITDRYAVVDGIVVRSRARGIVEGKSAGACALRYVEKSEDVKAGDLVVTSGLDNIFPKGFPVATVEAVESRSYSVSLRVDLRPVVDPNKVEEVFVLLNAANEDLTERFSMTQNSPPYPPEVETR